MIAIGIHSCSQQFFFKARNGDSCLGLEDPKGILWFSSCILAKGEESGLCFWVSVPPSGLGNSFLYFCFSLSKNDGAVVFMKNLRN